MQTLTAWIDWLLAGHNGPEMALVIRYLRREVSAARRNPGCLALRQLLNLENFEKDLGLAQMHKAGGFDPERRLSAPPDLSRLPTVAVAPVTADPAADSPVEESVRVARIAQLEALKREIQ